MQRPTFSRRLELYDWVSYFDLGGRGPFPEGLVWLGFPPPPVSPLPPTTHVVLGDGMALRF